MSRRSSLKPQVILLGLASMMNDISSDMIYPLLPIFLTSYVGATPFIVGMIEGSAEAVAAFLKLVAGAWSDRMARRKPLVVAGYALAAASRALIAGAGHWGAVLTARLLDRTGKGIRSAPRDALIAEVTPVESRGRAFGFHRALDHTGAVVGPLLAGVLLAGSLVSLRTLFYLAVVPAVIGVIMLLFLLREESRPVPLRADARAGRQKLPPRFWAAMSSVALFYLANSSDVFLILQATAAGVSMKAIPFLWAAHHLVKALFSTRAGALSDRRGRHNLLIAGWTVYAAIYLVFPWSRSLWAFLLLFVAYAVPFTLTEGSERAWISDLVPKESGGRSFGIYYLVVGICTLAGTALFGYLYQNVSRVTAFHAGAGLALLAAASVALQTRARRVA